VVISVGGGLLGISFGYFLAWLIARTAEWKTIVTTGSVAIAFGYRWPSVSPSHLPGGEGVAHQSD
jgi:hypothetical protein